MHSYHVGQEVRLDATFDDLAGSPFDPDGVTFTIRPPEGASDGTDDTTYVYGTHDELVKDSVGRYHVEFTPDTAGRWSYWWTSTGDDPDAEPGSILVEGLVAPWRPSVEDVGAILRARTRSDQTGAESGTFDDTTRPTATEAAGLIDQAEAELVIKLPTDIATVGLRLTAFARRLIALRASMLIELSLYPDQTVDTDSVYAHLKTLFDEGWETLLSALDDAGTDVPEGGRLVVATLVSPYSGDDETTDPLD